MQTAFRILKNTIALIMSTGIERLVSFILTLSIARALGVSTLGEFGLVISLSLIYGTIALVGQEQIVIREVGRDKSKAGLYLCNSGAIALTGSVLGAGLMILTAYGLGYEPHIVGYTAIMGLSLLPGALVLVGEALIQGLERMEFVTLVRLGGNTFKVVAGVGFLLVGFGLEAVFAVIVATQIVMAGLYLTFIIRLTGGVTWSLDRQFVRGLLKISTIFALIALFNVAFRSIDIVLLTHLSGMEEGGIYTAAYKLVQMGQALLPALMLSVYPVLSQSFVHNQKSFATTSRRTLKLLFTLIIPAALFLNLLAPQLVLLLYEQEFAASIPVFQILVWLLVPLAGNAVLFRTIYASNNERVTLRIVGVNMTINIGLNLLLIPRYGALGTSVAAVVSIGVGFVQNYWFVHRHLFAINLFQIAGRPLLSALISGIVVWFLRSSHPILSIAIGVGLYFLLLVALGGISKEERDLLRSSWEVLHNRLQKRNP